MSWNRRLITQIFPENSTSADLQIMCICLRSQGWIMGLTLNKLCSHQVAKISRKKSLVCYENYSDF